MSDKHIGYLPASACLPSGRYVVLRLETHRRIVAELMAHPDIFRSVGDIETWVLNISGAGGTTTDTRRGTQE